MIHQLKSWPEYFQPVHDGLKTFEIRRNDRDYHVGDILVLQEWSPATGYTKREATRRVTYMLKGPWFNPTHTTVEPALGEGWVIMALSPLDGPHCPEHRRRRR